MRTLVLMKGAPGCGKSTFIRNQGLEPYTLSPDTIRNMYAGPVIGLDGRLQTSHEQESKVWQTLMELLEDRMSRGEFTVIDATHSRTDMITRYRKLCKDYRYRAIVVDFTDVPLEVCQQQNLQRPDYKQVPYDRLENIYARFEGQQVQGWVKVVKPHELEEALVHEPRDFSHYRKIHHIGDIHGSVTVLRQYFEQNPVSEDELYIFTGDYIDRGTKNKDTLDYLLELSVYEEDGQEKTHRNFIFLEGNHERHLWRWANNEESVSKVFETQTRPQLETGLDEEALADYKKRIRQFYRRLYQILPYNYTTTEGLQRVLVTHGGYSVFPEQFMRYSTDSFINGIGNYEDDIDLAFTKNTADNEWQIHGHRNIYRLPTQAADRSFNLEGRIEYGGDLRVVQLTKEGFQVVELQNPDFNVKDIGKKVYRAPQSIEEMLENMSDHRMVRETKVTDSISSFNFTNQAFQKKKWDEMTVRARGLFINKENMTIASRGYDKFFNLNERRETRVHHLPDIVQFPVMLYDKPNGFLGLIGYDDQADDILLTTKSTSHGNYANMFRDLYEQTFSEPAKAFIKRYVKAMNVTLSFEVIDMERDPHIIKYDGNKLVLLDIIKRETEFKKLPYSQVEKLASVLGCEHKELKYVFENWQDFYAWYRDAAEDFTVETEGYVIEDSAGFMTKMKLPYYNLWKQFRGIKHNLGRGSIGDIKLGAIHTKEGNHVFNYLKTLDRQTLKDNDIITLRDMYLEHARQQEPL